MPSMWIIRGGRHPYALVAVHQEGGIGGARRGDGRPSRGPGVRRSGSDAVAGFGAVGAELEAEREEDEREFGGETRDHHCRSCLGADSGPWAAPDAVVRIPVHRALQQGHSAGFRPYCFCPVSSRLRRGVPATRVSSALTVTTNQTGFWVDEARRSSLRTAPVALVSAMKREVHLGWRWWRCRRRCSFCGRRRGGCGRLRGCGPLAGVPSRAASGWRRGV